MDTAIAHQIYPGSTLGKCYKVEKVLGEGGFGFVTKCCNTEKNEVVAIKVNKSHPNVVHETRKEIAILEKLRCLDPDTCNIVKWNGFFLDKDRICLDFELLDQSLRDYMQRRYESGLTMTELRPIIHQLATALYHLSSVGIAHRDLKPENVMIVNHMEQPLKVKLIDFGLACPVSDIKPNMFVGTICYMAPEVMLEIPYTEAVDMWSLGLLVAELATGNILYPGDTVYEMLHMITETQGLPPDHMLDCGMGAEDYFNRPTHDQQLSWTFKTPEQFVDETGENPPNLRYDNYSCLDDIVEDMVNDGEDERDCHLLTDLIKRMLQLDPDQRIKPLEVLQHPFFTENLPKSPKMDTNIEIRNTEETPEVCQINQTSELHVNDSSVKDTDEEEETSDELTGALQIFPGGRLGQCYRLEKVLKEGGFGFVTKCRNAETNEVVAIKCIKNHHKDVKVERQEIAVLERLRCLDPDTCNIVKWNGFFFDKDHTCLKFELLDQSLYKYMQCRYNNGLTTTELRPIIHQLATALYHLSSVGIVHRDLKPENVMIVNHMEQPLKVKLIDFGLACTLSHINSNICVGTTWYMAPEVMLQMPYNEAVDMWSLGLLVAELAMGYSLYPGDTVYEMLYLITETQGLPPDHMLDRGMRSEHFFNRPSHGQQHWTLKTPEQFVDETGENPEDLGFVSFSCLDAIQQMMANDGEDERDRYLLTDLIKRMLQLDPHQRIKPLEVLQHPFFTENLPKSPKMDTNIEIRNTEETPEVCQINQTSELHVNDSSVKDTDEEEETSDELAGALQIFPGCRLGQRYKLEKVLKEGGFGFVTKCHNTETNEVVAIKCIKNHHKDVKVERQEIAVLERLRCLDPDTCNIVKWNGFFFDKDHTCLKFELLDQSLYKYMQCRYNNGLTTTELRPIIHQLATALYHLSSVGIVHRDLKPENVMIVNHMEQPLKVKLIDFGLACTLSHINSNICVGTTWYMAPEVMLQMPYNEAVDMWSLGLLVAELAMGYSLYPGDTVYEMLYLITETQGLPPDHMLDRGMRSEHFFNRPSHGQQHWTLKTPEQFVDETGENPEDLGFVSFSCLDAIQQMMANDGEDERDRYLLTDLIKRMLQLDPHQRIKPLEVLQHPFFTENLPKSPKMDTNIEIRNTEETPEVCQINQTSELHVNDSSVKDTDEEEETSDELAGALQIFPGCRLGQRYKLEKVLKEGGFGFVTKCHNTETNEVVAIKCIKNHHKDVKVERQEIAVLERLRCLDPDTCNIVKWNGFFFDKDHTCLKFELLDQSLYKYMQCRYNNGLTTTELRPIIHQLATALYHLSSVGIVHRDLKPENVMIVNHMEQPLKVKLIDFGLACTLSHINSNICVGTTWYMAPEVMLQMPYNEAVDMWSLGLLVAELAMGYSLYPGDTVYEMLYLITETQGLPPDHMLDRGMRSEHFFNRPSHGQQHWTLKTPEQFVDETGENPEDLGFVSFSCLDAIQQMMANDGEDERDRYLLTDLIKRMLQLDPHQRIKPLEVLQHPFFTENLPKSPKMDTNIEIRNTEETPEVCQINQTSELHVNDSSVKDTDEEEETSDELAGALQIFPGCRLGQRYKLEKVLKEGGFGFVTKCHNTETNEVVAIKCIKNHHKDVKVERQEIAVLERLRCLDPDTCNIVKWNGFFFDKDHTCLKFELLDQSLYKYMQCRYNNGLTTTELRPIIHQLATALYHLSSVGIVHRDLKPDNVMIVNHMEQPLKVKLIDFGLACTLSHINSNICVGTTWYMAPEVMLQMPYNEAVDMWSLGLLVAELAMGYSLYPGDTVYEMLYLITETQGLPPDHMLDRGMRSEHFFNRPSHGQQHWTLKTPEQFVDETGENPEDLGFVSFSCLDAIQQMMANDGEDERDRYLLTDLIKRMLQLDPHQRIKPLEVLQHPFFTENLPKSPKMDTNIEIRNTEETPEVCQINQTSELHVNDSSVKDTDEEEETSDELAGALQIFPGCRLGQRYKLEKVLKEGGFGFVTKCHNTETNEVVAIKCIKNHHKDVKVERQEIAVLERLRCLDPDTCNIVKWNGFFFDKDHTCLKFELLDQSLYKYMQCRYNNGLTTTELRPIIHQLATALYHLSSVGIVHRDLKPENVMIVNHMEQPLKVKLIDFGLACTLSHINSNICVGTTWYMAPEVMLQMPYNEAVDMWSLGLLVAELAMGYSLYPGDTVYEMLYLITETQGLPPDHMLDRGMRSEHFFNRPSHGQQHWTLKTPEQFVDETGENPEDLGFVSFSCLDAIQQMMANDGEDERDRYLLTDLIKRMLQLDPHQRIKPLEVLQHPFFTENLPKSPKMDTNIEIRNTEETPEVCQINQTSELHVNDSSVKDTDEEEETSDELAGALQIFPGCRLGQRYKLEKVLKEGGFGFVTKCHNTETNEVVAIKCIKNHHKDVKVERQEIAVLEKLRCLDPDTFNIVKWNGFFFDKDHTCLKFELLDQSLYKYMQCRYNNGLTTTELRPIIYQLATALYHLSSVGIVHRDLKPDNVMIVNHMEQPLKVKLIDFGLACTLSHINSNICVGTTWYMAPEVMLQMPYNEAVDMWSLGLLVAELAMGYSLYPGDTVYEMLYLITETQGLPPDHMLDRGMRSEHFFNRPSHGQQHWTLKTPEQFVDETGENPEDLGFVSFSCLDAIQQMMANDGEDERDRYLLTDLIKRMLQLDPHQRIKPLEVLQHPFFTENLPKSPKMDTNIEIRNTEETPEVCLINQTSGLHVNDSSVKDIDEEEETSDELAGALQIFPGSTLGKCYKVEKVLKEGGFGFVTRCCNTEKNEIVAIKVNKRPHAAVTMTAVSRILMKRRKHLIS